MNKVLSFPHSIVLHIKYDPYLPCSAAITFLQHNQHTTQTQHCSSTAQFLHAVKTDHICHAQYSNYIAATHNITHSPCTSKCTTHPPLPTHCLPPIIFVQAVAKWHKMEGWCESVVVSFPSSLVGC